MRPIKVFMLAAFLIIAAISSAFIKEHLLKTVTDEGKGFAVVELFTSEGCSSCPPADELVAKIQKESKGKPVYILAYHVDYWNRLGWKDQFSSADYSKRQHDYADYLHLQSVYTPQVIVNGKTEFVGSEEGTLRNAIKNSLQKAVPAQIALDVASFDRNRAILKYSTGGTDRNTALLIAVLQKNAQTKVERGENQGRTLSHVQIVRKLQKVTLKDNNGSVNVDLPNGFDAQNWEITGFLQNTITGAITAATRVNFAGEVNASAAIKNPR